jgi:hypothetical protein
MTKVSVVKTEIRRIVGNSWTSDAGANVVVKFSSGKGL